MIESKTQPARCGVKTYPCIMQSRTSGVVVLFEREGVGVVLAGQSRRGHRVGARCTDWDTDAFDLFHGTVELKNI